MELLNLVGAFQHDMSRWNIWAFVDLAHDVFNVEQ